MAPDTTAALVLAHSWGDRRRRFVWERPQVRRGRDEFHSGPTAKGWLHLLRVLAAESGPFPTRKTIVKVRSWQKGDLGETTLLDALSALQGKKTKAPDV